MNYRNLVLQKNDESTSQVLQQFCTKLHKVGAKQVLAHITFSEDGYLLYFSSLQKIIPTDRMADTFPSEEEAPARKDQRKEFTADDSDYFNFVPRYSHKHSFYLYL